MTVLSTSLSYEPRCVKVWQVWQDSVPEVRVHRSAKLQLELMCKRKQVTRTGAVPGSLLPLC